MQSFAGQIDPQLPLNTLSREPEEPQQHRPDVQFVARQSASEIVQKVKQALLELSDPDFAGFDKIIRSESCESLDEFWYDAEWRWRIIIAMWY